MTKARFNTLDGKTWMKYSLSVWDDIQKTTEEKRLKHPAMFPVALVERVVDCYTSGPGTTVLDPFAGSGSTLVGALQKGRHAIGCEISPDYLAMAEQRCRRVLEHLPGEGEAPLVCAMYPLSATDLTSAVDPASVDLCFTSPPYWNILRQKRSADLRATMHYGDDPEDLGGLMPYEEYLALLRRVAGQVYAVLKPGCFFILNVMDLRKGPVFYPLHIDAVQLGKEVGFVLDDVIIWNRAREYNSLRPLGYPYMFRINKVHEYLLLLRKM